MQVKAQSVPTVSISPASWTMDLGQSEMFQAAASGGSDPLSYQWYVGGSLQSGAASSTFNYVPGSSGIYSISVTVTDSLSIISSPSDASVRVNSAPTVSVAPGGPVTIDVGQIQVFTATVSGGSGSLSYQWYLGGSAVSGQTGLTYTFTAVSVGSPTIYCKVTDQASTPYVVQSNTPSVTVNSAPTVSITPTGPITMDAGQTKIFTAASVGGSGTIHYQWYVGSGSVGTDSSSYTYTAAGSSASITCKVTDSASSPVTSLASNAVSVTVNPALVAPTVSASLGSISQGQTSSLTSLTVTTGSSPYSYQWFSKAPGAGSYLLISGATSPSYSFTTSGSTTVGSWSFELNVTDAASVSVTSNAVSVTVNSVPTVTVSPSSGTLDAGQSQVFRATASGGSGTYSSYQWYVDLVPQSGTAVSFTYSPGSTTGSHSITATVTDSLGGISVLSSPATVTVESAPSISTQPSSATIDSGQSVTLTSTVTGGTGSFSWQWFSNGGSISGASGTGVTATHVFNAAAAGIYVIFTDTGTGTATPTTVATSSPVVAVVVNSALVAPSVVASLGSINQGQTSSLTSSSVTTGSSPYIYQWFSKAPGAGSYSLISGATSPSYSFATSISTATGSWSFILQVGDAVSAVVNSSAVSIVVNVPPLDHFIFSSIGTQTAGTSFTITITAKDASNNTLTNYVGTNSLNVSIGTISPSSTGAFSKGVWTGSVTVNGAGSGVTIFSTGSGMSGTSNSFKVNPGAFNHFTFSAISSPQTSGSSFSITVTAMDVYGNVVTNYVGGPSLTVSAGSISPSSMATFVSGVGSTTVTVTGAGSGVTITVTDSITSGTSNSFTVTDAPTSTPSPTPTSTPSTTQGPTLTPTSTGAPKVTPTPTPTTKPLPSPTPTVTIVQAKTDSGATVNLVVSGNITGSQMSNVTITATNSTTVSIMVTGQSGTTGFSNITIPKTAIPYGTNPVVFIDGQQATYQGYTQDSQNFYVWYTTPLSTHLIKIQFAGSLKPQTSPFESLLAVGIITPEIILVFTVIAIRRLRRSPENT
jgi:hypothetical protein